MITLDTSGTLALLDPDDPGHRPALEVFKADPGPYLIPVETLGEIGHFVESRVGQRKLGLFLFDLKSGAYTLDWDIDRLTRIGDLIERYADLPLGLVDSAVIACAEANGGRVLTLDRRHFGAVAREGTITVLPDS